MKAQQNFLFIVSIMFLISSGGLFITTTAQIGQACTTVADCANIRCPPEETLLCQNSRCACVPIKQPLL